jgi:hypothetical protein
VNAIDAYGGTALHDAFRNGRDDVSQLLLARGGVMGARFNSAYALCAAAAADDVRTLRRLLEHKCCVGAEDFDGRTALHIAAANSQLAAATFLLGQPGVAANHEDRHGDTPLDDALRARGELQPVVANLVRAFGGRLGGHVLRPSIERSLAEQLRAVGELQRVEMQRSLLLMARRAITWVRLEALAVASLFKDMQHAVAVEEREGPVLADGAAPVFGALAEYAEGHAGRLGYVVDELYAVLGRWQQQADQYGALKLDLARKLEVIAGQLGGAVRPLLNQMREATFRPPVDPNKGPGA